MHERGIALADPRPGPRSGKPDDNERPASPAEAVALRERFEAFYLREFGAMVALAAAVSGSRAGAEDLAQEAMLRAHRRWATVSAYEKPGAWVRRVTINLATSAVRRRATEAKGRLRLLGTSRQVVPGPDPTDHRLWQAVRRLPAQQRAAVALFYLDDMSVGDIAEILGCSPSTAKVHLHRGRKALSTSLAADTADREIS